MEVSEVDGVEGRKGTGDAVAFLSTVSLGVLRTTEYRLPGIALPFCTPFDSKGSKHFE